MTIRQLVFCFEVYFFMEFFFIEKNGCNSVVKLEYLANHRSMCNNNPDSTITCNKGCNLPMKRSDQESRCIEHLKNRINSQDEDISRLSKTLQGQSLDNSELKEQVANLQTTVFLQRAEITSLELEKLDSIVAPFSKVRFLLNADSDIVWNVFDNMKEISNPGLGILESDNKLKSGFAQLAHFLTPSRPSFSLCVANNGTLIGMGLTDWAYSGTVKFDDSFLYLNNGSVLLNNKIIRSGEPWEEGDYISCEIESSVNVPTDSCISGPHCLMNQKVSFYRNFKEITTISSAELPGLFPTVWIGPI